MSWFGLVFGGQEPGPGVGGGAKSYSKSNGELASSAAMRISLYEYNWAPVGFDKARGLRLGRHGRPQEIRARRPTRAAESSINPQRWWSCPRGWLQGAFRILSFEAAGGGGGDPEARQGLAQLRVLGECVCCVPQASSRMLSREATSRLHRLRCPKNRPQNIAGRRLISPERLTQANRANGSRRWFALNDRDTNTRWSSSSASLVSLAS